MQFLWNDRAFARHWPGDIHFSNAVSILTCDGLLGRAHRWETCISVVTEEEADFPGWRWPPWGWCLLPSQTQRPLLPGGRESLSQQSGWESCPTQIQTSWLHMGAGELPSVLPVQKNTLLLPDDSHAPSSSIFRSTGLLDESQICKVSEWKVGLRFPCSTSDLDFTMMRPKAAAKIRVVRRMLASPCKAPYVSCPACSITDITVKTKSTKPWLLRKHVESLTCTAQGFMTDAQVSAWRDVCRGMRSWRYLSAFFPANVSCPG